MVLQEQEPGTSGPLVGQALPYLDAVERVTGAVPYTLNFELPGMLHVKLLRSPHAHARIRRIDASAAEQVPGVAYVLTGPTYSAGGRSLMPSDYAHTLKPEQVDDIVAYLLSLK